MKNFADRAGRADSQVFGDAAVGGDFSFGDTGQVFKHFFFVVHGDDCNTGRIAKLSASYYNYIMKEIKADKSLVACCGLYCGACQAYLKDKCKGCRENLKATWCQIRKCCLDNKYGSCADCKDFKEVNDCKKFNNIVSKIFAFVFKSDRKACIEQIKSLGLAGHAESMAKSKQQSIKK